MTKEELEAMAVVTLSPATPLDKLKHFGFVLEVGKKIRAEVDREMKRKLTKEESEKMRETVRKLKANFNDNNNDTSY